MKWIRIIEITLVMAVGLTGCRTSDTVTPEETVNIESVKEADTKKTEEQSSTEIAEEKVNEKILIAYFTWADNTVVEDEEATVQGALDHYEAMRDAEQYKVDAASSASVVQPGNTAMIAEWIQEEVGGDLFSIRVTDPYPSDYNDCMDRASEEKSDNARPELKEQVEDFDQYDTIFLGFPNWWSSLPMPIHTFLESYNFSGKTVVPFCTHGTGGVAVTVRELEDALPKNAELLDVLGVYRAGILNAQKEIQEWLKKLGVVQ